MLTLSILGFLSEGPMHAYDLRARISELSGHVRPVSDGALYPALDRLEKAGFLTRHTEEGRGAALRRTLTLTDAGHAELLHLLAEPKDVEITDRNSFFVMLAFLGRLADPAAQARVLRRRLDFMNTPASYFYADGIPLRAEDVDDRFRNGMLTLARATSTADRAWLEETITTLETEAAKTTAPG